MHHARRRRLLPALLLALPFTAHARDHAVPLVDRSVVAPMVPMIVAASVGDVPTMQKLLAHGTALEEHDLVGTTPLIFAARYGRLPLVKFLLQRGANINAQTYSGANALSEAVRRGSLPVVKALLEAGADVQLRDDRRRTALFIAVGYRDLAIIDALLAHGSDIAAMNENGDTPLKRAADLGLATIVATLLTSYHAAAPIEHIDDALCAAERHGYRDIASLLKARGAGCHVAATAAGAS